MVAHSLPTLLRLVLREIDSPTVEVVPEPTCTRLAGARTFADWGAEAPLLLLDDSADGSGADGALLTSDALYFSKPSARVPLRLIHDVVQFPAGPKRPGQIPGADGPLALPFLKSSAARDALVRAIAAVAMANGASTNLVLPPLPTSPTPIGELVRRHLIHRDIRFASELRPSVLRAIVLATDPLDGWAGEQPLAVLDESGGAGAEGLLLSDRRLLYRRGAARETVPYSAIRQVGVDSWEADGVLWVQAEGGVTSTLSFGKRKRALPAVAAFLQQMIRELGPEERCAPLAVEPTPSDPAGLESAAKLLQQEDPRPAALCRLVSHAVRARAMPLDVAADYARRLPVLGHELALGRAMHEGWWVSPLPSPDLLFLLRLALWRPFRETPSGEGQELWFTFDAGRAAEWAKAVAASPLGATVQAVLGVGWARAKLPPIAALRLDVQPFGPYSLFGVTAMREGHASALDELAAPAWLGLDGRLAPLEARMLLIRVLMGTVFTAAELWPTPEATLQQRAQAIGANAALISSFGVAHEGLARQSVWPKR